MRRGKEQNANILCGYHSVIAKLVSNGDIQLPLHTSFRVECRHDESGSGGAILAHPNPHYLLGFQIRKEIAASTYMYIPAHRLFYQLGDNVRASLAVSHRTSLLNLALLFTLAQIPSLTDRVETEPEINVI